jgi:septal ring factor EnvC (AmiA/AmiB activator)
MVNTYTSGLEEKLRQAEDAADEVSRLASLASQAPLLRAEVARVQRQEERDANRKNAIEQAKRAVAAAAKKQDEVPATLETVSKMVYSLYTTLKEIDNHRKEASQAMAIVDRMDYEEEVESGGEEQQEMGRDPKSIEFLVASRHGQTRIKQLLDQMDPDFSYLRGCEVDEPLRRDVANFILAHLISPAKASRDNSGDPALPRDPQG